MPDQETLKRAEEDRRAGKSSSTQAGEFVREEIHHIRDGKHGARSAKQAIAIGLSKARRAGVKLPPPKAAASEETKKQAARDTARGHERKLKVSATRSRATLKALKKEADAAGTPLALARQAKASARKRSAADRSMAAQKAARTRARSR